jgi:hypothetical protein
MPDLGLPTPPAGQRWRPTPTPLEQHNVRHAARMREILSRPIPRPLPVLPARLHWLAAAIATAKGL